MAAFYRSDTVSLETAHTIRIINHVLLCLPFLETLITEFGF